MVIRRAVILKPDHSLLYDGPIYKLPLKMEAVLDKFYERYRDCPRCQRRILAVKQLLYSDLEEYFISLEENTAELTELPPEILGLLDVESLFGRASD